MTLALYGKSRRRQWMLVALALFALLGAFGAAFAVRESARAEQSSRTLNLHNDSAQVGTDCPADGKTYWHFVINPNNNKSEFVQFKLNLGDGTHTISSFVLNGTQKDNVFVEVPSGYQLSSLVKSGSTADILWDGSNPEPDKFVLSHTCPGTPTGNIIVGKVIDPSAGVAPADGTIFSGTIVNDGTQASTPWSGISFGQFTSPISAPAGVQLTVDEDSPANGWSEVGWATGSLDTENNPVCPADKNSYSGHENIGVNLTPNQTMVLCVMNTKQSDTPTRVLEVCKHVESDSAGGGVFTITVSGRSNFVTGTLAPGGDECKTYTVPDGAEITLTETGFPAGWVSSTGYPQVDFTGVSPATNNTVTVTVGEGTCEAEEEGQASAAQTTEVVADCTVTFYNKSEGQVSPTGDLRIEKYLDINGDGDADDVALGEGPIVGWNMTVGGPDVNGVFPTGAGGFVSFSGLDTGDNYTVTEALPAGWMLTNVKVDGANSVVNVTKNVTIPNGATRVVAFYNQPLGSLTVNKVALTSHNNSPDVPSPQDRDGWLITVSSAACGYSDTKPTDVNGNATFTGLPKCTDYVVSENTSNPQSPNFVPVGASSVSNVTPNGQTITFTNRRATFDIVIITPTPVIPTPTPTFTPTNTPTSTPTNTPTATPTPEETQAGVRTPGPTPIAPSTGTGGGGGAASVNLLLLIAGFAVLSGGATLAAVGKRRR